MEVSLLTDEELVNLYLDFCENFTTPESFGEHYDWDYEQTWYIIGKGKELFNL